MTLDTDPPPRFQQLPSPDRLYLAADVRGDFGMPRTVPYGRTRGKLGRGWEGNSVIRPQYEKRDAVSPTRASMRPRITLEGPESRPLTHTTAGDTPQRPAPPCPGQFADPLWKAISPRVATLFTRHLTSPSTSPRLGSTQDRDKRNRAETAGDEHPLKTRPF